jgi:NAD(P)-dependent dehydrogenase (short-subunit alcohol dehydrogenase family)
MPKHRVAALQDEYGPLDAAVNNAAVEGPFALTADTALDAWRDTLDVNLTGVFVCLREELRFMAPRHRS